MTWYYITTNNCSAHTSTKTSLRRIRDEGKIQAYQLDHTKKGHQKEIHITCTLQEIVNILMEKGLLEI